MEGDEVGAGYSLLQAHRSFHSVEAPFRQERIIHDYLHPEGAGALGHFAPDATEAEEGKATALETVDIGPGERPPTASDHKAGIGDRSYGRQQ
jgi:hypothetical protein